MSKDKLVKKQFNWKTVAGTVELGKRGTKNMLYLWWKVTSNRRKKMVLKEMSNRFLFGKP